MKKVCILSAVNVKHMSLISLYTDILKKYDVTVDLVYMDKYGEPESFECHRIYRYENIVDHNRNRALKALQYLKFIPYAKKILKQNQYDFIIVWNDVAIFMFADILRRHYRGKYCLNVRDNMKYDKKIFAKRYQKCFANSAFNTVSSVGYLDFLPKGVEYLPIHSLNLKDLEGTVCHTALRKEGEPIRIGFIGSVRFFDRNKKLMSAFANDARFELHYYGKNAEVLENYANENGITNTRFHGSFPVEETKYYLGMIDVMNNLYGNTTINLRKAISIKFYHALYTRIPILVCPNTYIGQLAKDLQLGYEVDDNKIDKELPEKFYQWYRALDFDTVDSNADQYLKMAKEQNELLEKHVMEYIG